MPKRNVVVAGHICLDITPVFPNGEKSVVKNSAEVVESTLHDILVPGTLVRVNDIDIHTGGVVANTGLAMRFFGLDVTLMGKVGGDAFGSMIMDILKQHGSTDGMLVSNDDSTSYTIVIAVPGSDRIFLHNPGANDRFTSDDLDYSVIRKSQLFHFGYPPLMQHLYENQGKDLVRMFKKIDDMGVLTSLDLAAVDGRTPAAAANWKGILSSVLPFVDLFVPSFEELAYMLDPSCLTRLRCASGDPIETLSFEHDVAPLAEQALSLGAKVVLIKCGSRGLYCKTADEQHFAPLRKKAEKLELSSLASWSGQSIYKPAFTPRSILSATGAGDTCIAAFLSAMLTGYPLSRCLTLASATGASCLEAYDAFGGLKPFSVLDKMIAEGWSVNIES